MGYGVIGNTKVSGSFVLGSSPGTPASKTLAIARVFCLLQRKRHSRLNRCIMTDTELQIRGNLVHRSSFTLNLHARYHEAW